MRGVSMDAASRLELLRTAASGSADAPSQGRARGETLWGAEGKAAAQVDEISRDVLRQCKRVGAWVRNANCVERREAARENKAYSPCMECNSGRLAEEANMAAARCEVCGVNKAQRGGMCARCQSAAKPKGEAKREILASAAFSKPSPGHGGGETQKTQHRSNACAQGGNLKPQARAPKVDGKEIDPFAGLGLERFEFVKPQNRPRLTAPALTVSLRKQINLNRSLTQAMALAGAQRVEILTGENPGGGLVIAMRATAARGVGTYAVTNHGNDAGNRISVKALVDVLHIKPDQRAVPVHWSPSQQAWCAVLEQEDRP